LAATLDERHNGAHPWQGPFRVGWPDLVMARYARTACRGVDAVALTHLDAVIRHPAWHLCVAYDAAGRTIEWPLSPPDDLVGRTERTRALARVEPQYTDVRDAAPGARVSRIEAAVSEAYGANVRLASYGPTAADVQRREGGSWLALGRRSR
jgi:adenylosuccinate synthase